MNKIMKTLSMMFAMGAMLVGNGINNVETKVAKAAGGSFIADDVVTASTYATYENTNWLLTLGGNNKSGGTNSKSRSKCNLSNYSKYIGDSGITTSTTAFAIANLTSFTNIGSVSFKYTGGSDYENGTAYLTHSTDGIIFTSVSLTSGTQGMAIGTINTDYKFSFDALDGYFALIVADTATSGNFRFDYLNVDFIEAVDESATLQSISVDTTQSKTQYYVNESIKASDTYVLGSYSNNTSSQIRDGYTTSPSAGYTFTNEDIGDSKTITVSYEGVADATYSVKVLDDAASSIYWNNWYVPCVIGSAFDLGDSTFKAVYLSGLEKAVDGSEIIFKLGDTTIEPGYIFKAEDDGKVLTYIFEEASYTKTISLYEPSTYKNADFTLVKDINDLKAGDKIVIANAEYGKALSFIQNTNNRGQVTAAFNGDVLTAPGAVEVLTFGAGADEGTYSLSASNGYLYAAGETSTKNNYLRTAETLDIVSSWTIEIAENGNAIIKSADTTVVKNTLRYNDFNGIFSCYAADNQNDVAIYKLSATAELKSLIKDVTNIDTCSEYNQYDELVARYNALSEEEKAIFDATKVGNYTLGHKLSYMGELAKANENTSNANNNLFTSLNNSSNTSFVLIIGVMGLMAIAAYYFLNKKKVSC